MRGFIGILTPPDLTAAVEEARGWMKKSWGCRSGMKTPPHITLIPPFPQLPGTPEPEENDLTNFVRGLNTELRDSHRLPLEIALEGVGHFGPRTLFFSVKPTPALVNLQSAMEARIRERWPDLLGKNTFHPHLTVANRDIPPEALAPSLEWLGKRAPSRQFPCSRVTLFLWKEEQWKVHEVLYP